MSQEAGTSAVPGEATRRSLLEAAEELFAEKGFAETSVRDITERAGSNLASVNYHFGGKENLYVAVFRTLLAELREQRLASLRGIAGDKDVDLETMLRVYATAFLQPLVAAGRGRRMIQLFMREMTRPKLSKGIVHEVLVKPVDTAFCELLRRYCPGLSGESALLCLHSFVGQILHVLQAQRIYGDAGETDVPFFDLARTVDHIARFSAAGVRHLAGEVRP